MTDLYGENECFADPMIFTHEGHSYIFSLIPDLSSRKP